jgi:hypothetical protein
MENLEEKEVTFLTEKDIENIINSLSDDIIFDSLKEQIENVFISADTNPTYFLTYFTTKYDFIMNKYSDYEEVTAKVKEIREDFFFKVKALIEEKFDFVVEFPESVSMENQIATISHMYDFFVIRNKRHLLNILINYIEKELKNLIKHYKPLIDKKDLTYTNMKKYVNKDITVVVCKLPEIINEMIIDSAEDLLKLAIDDSFEITNNIIHTVLVADQAASFGGTFVEKMVSAIKQDETYYLYTRNHLMQKYNQK